MNLASVLLAPAASTPDALALRDDDRTLSYRELADVSASFAARLVRHGITPGDRVAIIGANSAQFVVAYLGVLSCGAVAVPLNPGAPARELARQLADVAPSLVVGAPGAGADIGAEAEARGVALLTVVAIEPEGGFEAPPPVVERARDDLAVLLFTAGTAGAPKAAMLTHGNLAANIRQVLDHPGLRMHPGDVGLALLPFFHVFGLNVVLGVALAAGAASVLVPEFRPAESLDLVRRHHVTVLAGVPTMWSAWLTVPDAKPDAFASVRLAVSGAAALGRDTAQAMLDRFGVVVHEGYGLTEASPIVATSAVGDTPRFATIGPPLRGVAVRLVDADGSDVLAGDPGEIWVRGPNVFPGYWRDPETTATVLTPDGWLRTGDVAIADDDGYLSLVDRTKDLIIVSGFNVFPAEVEDVLREHPAVVDVAVVGVPSARTGEAVAAYVVAPAGTAVAALDAWCATRLARYKRPVLIEVVGELPRTSVGKVLRRALRDGEPDATRNPA